MLLWLVSLLIDQEELLEAKSILEITGSGECELPSVSEVGDLRRLLLDEEQDRERTIDVGSLPFYLECCIGWIIACCGGTYHWSRWRPYTRNSSH